MERINPSVKTVMLLLLGLTLSFNGLIWVNGAVIALSALCLIGAPIDRKKAFSMLAGALVIALSLFFTALLFGREGAQTGSKNFLEAATQMSSVRNGIQLATRILAFAGIGLVFAFTTGRDELVASYIHQLHLPPKYAYGVLAAFHCAGHIRREFAKVRLAFAVRGLPGGAFSPKPLFVMLVNALHWSGDLAAAMESKGFDGTRNRTYHCVPRVTPRDYLFIFATAALIAACILCN